MLRATLRKNLRDFPLNVELTVQPGEVLVLLGENGSGKSTILNLLAGLLIADEGEITLNNRVLFCSTDGTVCPPEERNIGYVFQNYALFPHMSVFDNIAFGLKVRKRPKEQIHRQINQTLDDMGISQVRDQRVTDLSGGQRQRVALARALVIQPHLLLLDEPLTALDQATREKIRLELREHLVQSRQPAILVTHSIRDAKIIGDRVMVLEKGMAIWTGKPDDLQSGIRTANLADHLRGCDDYVSFSSIAID